MKLLKIIVYFIFSLSVLSCKSNGGIEEIRGIDIIKAFDEKQNIKLSSFVKKVEYIPLETNKKFLLDKSQRVFVNEQYIIIMAFRQQYLFNRKTGLFIREIGHYGRDPSGYLATKFNLAFDESKNVIFSHGMDRGIVEYSLQNFIINKIPKPSKLNAYRSFISYEDSIYIAYVPNFSGSDSVKLALIDWNGNLQSTLPNNSTFIDNPKKTRNFGDNEGWFYRYDKKLYLKELFNDTIFEIGGSPVSSNAKYVFNLGKYHPPYNERDYMKFDDEKNYFWLQNIFESSDYVFFTLKYNEELRVGIYNKKNGTTSIADSKEVDCFYYHWRKYGFINDFDNFIQLNPEYLNSNNELIGLIQPFEIVKWFYENPKKAAKLPPHLKKLKNIKETDNPIVMIATLKE